VKRERSGLKKVDAGAPECEIGGLLGWIEADRTIIGAAGKA